MYDKLKVWTAGLVLTLPLITLDAFPSPDSVDQGEEPYSYQYRDRLIVLEPSETLLAVADDSPLLGEFSDSTGWRRDALSDTYALVTNGLALYRRNGKGVRGHSLSAVGETAEDLGIPTQPVFEQGGALSIPSDELIVAFDEDLSEDDAWTFLTTHAPAEGLLDMRLLRPRTFVVQISEAEGGRAFAVSRTLAALSGVAYAEPNMVVVHLTQPRRFPTHEPSQIMLPRDQAMSLGAVPFDQIRGFPGLLTTDDAPNWTTLLTEGFESDLVGWGVLTQGVDAVPVIQDLRAHAGTRALYMTGGGTEGVSAPGPYPNNVSTCLLSPVLDLAPFEEAYLELWFYAKYQDPDFAAQSVDLGQLGFLDEATGQGEFEQALLVEYTGDLTADPTTQSGWRRALVRVPPIWRKENVRVLIRFLSDAALTAEGLYVDDVRVVGTVDVDTEPVGDDTYGARGYELKNSGQIAGLGGDDNDLNVPEAWDLVPVSEDVVVAVIDSGVELDHPDLNLVTGYDGDTGLPGGAPKTDDDNHGMACAGNVGAVRDNGIGTVGTAPGVKIMPIRWGSTYDAMAFSIDLAVEHGADVLSNSWGWVISPIATIAAAVDDALAAGRVVIFAAGNGPDRAPWTYETAFPCNLTETTDVICVGASSPTDEHKNASSSDGLFGWGSSYIGPGPDVVAPGPWSYTTDRQGALGYNQDSTVSGIDADYTHDFGGTSSSTPKVAGIVALMLSKNPSLTPGQVKTILRDTAHDIDLPGVDDRTGAGRVDVLAAIEATPSTQHFLLRVQTAGDGAGTVTSDPPGIDCGSDCGESYASGTGVTLTATVEAGSAFDGWSGDCTGTGSCVLSMTADRNVTATFTAGGTPLGDALDSAQLAWTTAGDAVWVAQTQTTHDGVDAAKAGVITHNQASHVQTTVTGPGTLSFYWKVSSEEGWDYLMFVVDGFVEYVATGEVDWQQIVVDVFEGEHALRWSYAKDESVDVGADTGWLDQVVYNSFACDADAYEPDDAMAQASVIVAGETQTRSICPTGDEDWAGFSLAAASAVAIETSGETGDTQLWLLDGVGNTLAFNDDDGEELFSRIERDCGDEQLEAGTYYVKVDEYGDDDPIASYGLLLVASPCTVPAPDIRIEPLALTFEELDGDETDGMIGLAEPTDYGILAARQDAALQDLLAKAAREPVVRVVVGMDLGRPFVAEGWLDAQAAGSQRRAIRSAQAAVMQHMAGHGARSYARFKYIPYMGVEVDAAALRVLAGLPEVRTLNEDIASPPTMASSVPVIGADAAWAMGYDGSGQVVAVLDTGVDKTHPFFATGTNKVVSEACYSTTGTNGSTSVCPGGMAESTVPGSGLNCDMGIYGCDHGTHVAGTVAGDDGVGPNFGVARGAGLIAVQVFSRFEGCSPSSGPCVLSYDTDQMKGLERVYELRGSYPIAAVNISIGGGRYYDEASCDADNPDMKAAVDNLRSVGIATISSSGNQGYRDSMGAPECISSVISVGAIDDFDNVAEFSNIAPFLDALAPGVSIESSVPGGGIATMQGTSMASPHVAGAWAVLKQYEPSAGVAGILAALRETATVVADTRSYGIETDLRRINVDAALGGTPSGQSIEVHNDGNATLVVTGIEPQAPAPWLSIAPTSLQVPAGQSGLVWIDAHFDQAPAGISTVRLLVYSNDPDESPYPDGVQVTVVGTVVPDHDGDGIPDDLDPDDDNDGIADWADPDPSDAGVRVSPICLADATARVELGWTAIDSPSGYLEAVVIAGPPTYHGADPGVVRLKNVCDLCFDLCFQEWDYRERDFGDTGHMSEDIPYVVLQSGRHVMSDDSVWEIGTFELGNTESWQGVSFTEPFLDAPYLFLTVQTYNGVQAVSVRARNVSVDGFESALFEEQALNDGHAQETVGYLAIHSPAGGGLLEVDGRQVPYLLQSINSNHRWSPVLSQRLMVEEEESVDSETWHMDETLHVLALGGQLIAQQVSDNGGDPTALRRLEPTADAPMEWGLVRGIDHDWQTLPFAKSYADPILVAKPVSNQGGDPGVIRLQGVTGNRAQVRYQEWVYLDGRHMHEDVFYLVAEAGEHSLGGLTVEAGWVVSNKLAPAGQWEGIGFNAVFDEPPVVLAAVMTYEGADAVTTRIRDLDFSGFDLAMVEQESKNDGHVDETLGWIAIAQGSGTTAEGRKLEVFFEQLNHVLIPVVYPSPSSHRHPTVVGDVDSAYGGDPVFLRYASPTNAQIELKITEEQSMDDETFHALEDVGVFVGE